MSQPFKLFRLQQLDSQLDQAHTRLHEIKIALKDDNVLRKTEKKTENISKSLREMQESLRQAEANGQAQRMKIEQTEATLYSGKVRNPKELQDLHNESAALKRFLVVLEDRQLEAMLTLDEVEEDHASAFSMLDKVRAEAAFQNKKFTGEQTKLFKKVEHLESERQASTASIPNNDLRIYEQLRQRRGGVAVAKVTDKNCAACGSTLSTSLLHTARSPNQITYCDSCGRILYAG